MAKVSELMEQARALEAQGETAKALAVYQHVLPHLETMPAIKADLSLKAGDLMLKLGNTAGALSMYETAGTQCAVHGSTKGVLTVASKIQQAAPNRTDVLLTLAGQMVQHGHAGPAVDVLIQHAKQANLPQMLQELQPLAGRPSDDVRPLVQMLLDQPTPATTAPAPAAPPPKASRGPVPRPPTPGPPPPPAPADDSLLVPMSWEDQMTSMGPPPPPSAPSRTSPAYEAAPPPPPPPPPAPPPLQPRHLRRFTRHHHRRQCHPLRRSMRRRRRHHRRRLCHRGHRRTCRRRLPRSRALEQSRDSSLRLTSVRRCLQPRGRRRPSTFGRHT